jgi:hypothetical protein
LIGQLDQGVPGPAASGAALALQAQGLAFLGAGRDGDVDRAAVREGHALLAALDRVFQVDVEAGLDVAALLRETAGLAAAAERARAPAAAEHAAEQLREVDLRPLVAVEAAATEAAGVERAIAGLAAEAARGLATVGVDLAQVELLALLGVADDVEGGADLLELLLGLLVPRIGVRVMGLGELAERLADLVRGRGAGNAEFLIGVARQGVSSGKSGRLGTALHLERPEPAQACVAHGSQTCRRRDAPTIQRRALSDLTLRAATDGASAARMAAV